MLSPEQAQEALKQHQLDGDVNLKRQLQEISGLDEDLRATAYAFIYHDENGGSMAYDYHHPMAHEVRMEKQRKIDEAIKKFRIINAQERQAIFRIFFPKISEYVELGWLLLGKQPYQTGYVRKSFRVKTQVESNFQRQMTWLRELMHNTGGFHEDLSWFAQHSAYISHGWAGNSLGYIFAAVIDEGGALGQEIYEILLASAKGEHPIGTMGRHVSRALLTASKPAAWDFMEKMLLAAQRQEGLRQTILETIDEAHPEAFQRMLRLIFEHNLVRFSAVVRAVDVWLGYNVDSENPRSINETIAKLLSLLENPEELQKSLETGNGESVYLALWTMAFEDAHQAIPIARQLLADEKVERRFAALHLLANLQLEDATRAIVFALDDTDVRLVGYACLTLRLIANQLSFLGDSLFEKLEAVLPRIPERSKQLEPLIWDWMRIESNRGYVAALLINTLENRSPKHLIPYMSIFDSHDRLQAGKKLATLGLADPDVRAVLLKLLGDTTAYVRAQILEIFKNIEISQEDALSLEPFLSRKANDLRLGILSLLIRQEDTDVLQTADRLISSKKSPLRLAGLELLQMLNKAERLQDEVYARAQAYQNTHPKTEGVESSLLEAILNAGDKVSLDNLLGLIDPGKRTKAPEVLNAQLSLDNLMKRAEGKKLSQAAIALLQSLDELVHEHATTSFVAKAWDGEREVLLGNANFFFPVPNLTTPIEEEISNLPLAEVWQTWNEQRGPETRDEDGLELLRAWLVYSPRGYYAPHEKAPDDYLPRRYPVVVERLLVWLLRLENPPNAADFILDYLEAHYAQVTDEMKEETRRLEAHSSWRSGYNSSYRNQMHRVREFRALSRYWEAKHDARFYSLLRWLDEPITGAKRFYPAMNEVLSAYKVGAATDEDIYDQLFGSTHDLRWLSSKKSPEILSQYPTLAEILQKSRERILELELKRGEMPTISSYAASALASIYGIRWFVRIVAALVNDKLNRGYVYNSHFSRSLVFSHLLRVSFPEKDESKEAFAKAVKQAKLSQTQLIEAAVYAPQWASFVEAALKWEGFSDAVWWVHAHTKDSSWRVDAEIRETWSVEVSERTPLSAGDLLEGAVDINWFWEVYKALGEKRWTAVYDAAKYSAGGQGHSRAKLFADALLGKLQAADVLKRITETRHQDSVRALGLMPLPKAKTEAEILKRYRFIQDFVRGSRKFGAQRQESEKLAARIGLENLARNAGYPDPLRLQWAMEAAEVADLRTGAISVALENLQLSLRIDAMGKPALEIFSEGKKLKSIPNKFKKNPDYLQLRDRKQELDRQHSRMRLALEGAMWREDNFTGVELAKLAQHPVLAPMLEQVIFVSDKGMGYPVDEAQALLDYKGKSISLGADDKLRIAHPHDLYQSGAWSQWQHECFVAERIQPFKQVFRELYLLTEAEKAGGAISRRYAGHQIQPRQAMALLGSRAWISRPNEGIQRSFHKHKLSAHLNFMYGFYTPADVEGLTIEGVSFSEPNRWQPVELEKIPPILFSEVMRDIDLVVSVAHRGGVDPESSASTVDMRSALITETTSLLKIENVVLQGSHALIQGKLGHYSLHLGSGIVHRQPGGALCIIPVHAQHRGRIFLPFMDDDPKTAEIISKVLLLARDTEIKDPSILEQIYA